MNNTKSLDHLEVQLAYIQFSQRTKMLQLTAAPTSLLTLYIAIQPQLVNLYRQVKTYVDHTNQAATHK